MYGHSGIRKRNRVIDLYFYIKKNGPVRMKVLIDEFNVSERTVQRDLDLLQIHGLVTQPKGVIGRSPIKK
jgi:DeoR/GlpR family transcriptional regulator of sugar metabolism